LNVSTRSEIKLDVESVWEDYSGEGVKVGVVDSQIDFKHVELADAYDTSADFNFALGTGDFSINSRAMGDSHGTLVAGVIAAEGGNGLGSVGLAHGVTLVGLAIDYRSSSVLDQAVRALNAGVDLDVLNCSWSFARNFADNFNQSNYSDLANALKNLAQNGRDGLGTSVVFSAGNSGIDGSSNYHNCQNSPYTIAVGAVSPDGDPWASTSLGANVLVSAPGDRILTTSPNNRYVEVSGTSFAAPLVTSVIALMYEANSNLGYRDVQQILALTATREGLSDDALEGDGWLTNGTSNVNGGGMHFSDAFGFGMVNAHAAVRLAETWIVQQTAEDLDKIVVNAKFDEKLVAGSKDHISIGLKIDKAISVEHVQFSFDLIWRNTGDLDVYLTSPEGTAVRLVYDQEDTWFIGAVRNFTFTSVATMGEMGTGTWTVDIYNRNPNAVDANGLPISGTLRQATLTLLGNDDDLQNDLYVYTDEFAGLVRSDPSRAVLRDIDGGIDTLNASAVTSNIKIDLTGAGKSMIGDTALGVARDSGIENVFTGDGDDRLTGSAKNNWFEGGRGNDTFVYSAGSDTLDGGAGIDTLVFTHAFSTVSRVFDAAGNFMIGVLDLGYSLVTEIEVFSFLDVTYLLADLTVNLGDPIEPPPQPPVDVVVIPAPEPPVTIVPPIPDVPATGEPVDEAPNRFDRTFTGTDGDDRLVGQTGRDNLIGGAGNDKLFGGAGDDRLEGGGGNDLLVGGAGADRFVFNVLSGGRDTIRDFNAAEGDTIQIVGLLPVNHADVSLLVHNGSTFLQVTLGDDTIRLAKIMGTDLTSLSDQQIYNDGCILFG